MVLDTQCQTGCGVHQYFITESCTEKKSRRDFNQVICFLTLLQWCEGALQDLVTSLLGVASGATWHTSDYVHQ